ncbi:MAG TPA: amphi-Trp domain-containing protein [Chloroflexota bacterium]|nr:amphi-Trp domain-containing protein [Chloroflexota bacterium]
MGHDHHHHRRGRVGEETSIPAGEKRGLRMRATLDRGQVADHLSALAQALRAGGVTLRSGGQTLMLHAAESVELEVHAGEEGDQSMVRLALRWQTPAPQADLEITPGVKAAVSEQQVDAATHAHEAGIVLPGDPAAPPSALGHAPRGSIGAVEQQAEA